MNNHLIQAENKRLSTAMLQACEQNLLSSHEADFICKIILLWSDYCAIPACKLEELANSTTFTFAHNVLIEANILCVVKVGIYRFEPSNITHGNLEVARQMTTQFFGGAE